MFYKGQKVKLRKGLKVNHTYGDLFFIEEKAENMTCPFKVIENFARLGTGCLIYKIGRYWYTDEMLEPYACDSCKFMKRKTY